MSIVSKLVPLFAQNAHAIRYFDDKRRKWNYRKIGRPLDEAALTKHISRGDPEFSLGAYVLRDLENSTGHALIFDFDDHDGDSAQLIQDAAIKFCTILDDLGLPYLLFCSGGGKGFHFYLLFQEPQTKSWLRAAGKFLLCEKLGFKDGTNGVKAGEVEIFPKGDHFGGQNVIALPMARKSVALRREGDGFAEALEPGELTFCPVLSNISDPGYGRSLSPTDHRRDFLAALLEYADSSAYGIPSFDPETKASCWQKVEEPLTLEVASTTEHVVGAYFPIDAATEKSQILVIRTSSPEAFASALQNTRHFVVSSTGGFFYVWCVFAKARRKDQLKKIFNDAAAKATDSKALSMVGGTLPVPLPLTGASQFVSHFDGNIPVFGPAPSTVPVNTDRQPGPKRRAENRDQAFDRLSGSLDPSDHEDWVNCGHLLIACFGKDDPWAFERWSEWSLTAENADPLDELLRKWEKLDPNPRYSPASFWLMAKQAGYDGAMPFGKAEERKHRCVDLVSGVELFRSQEEVSFATIGPRQHVEVRSRAFEQFLRLQTYDTAGELLSAEDLKAVVETVDAQCQKGGKRIPIHLRIAREGAKGYLCLGDDARTVIEYDANGFRECAEPPVRFRVAPGARPLPLPVAGKIEDLRALFNLDDENWVLLLSWLVMTLVHPGRPTPICVLNGEHGSAKTTALKQIVSILDPKVGATAGPPKNEDDLIASAYSSQVVSFDNVSSFHTLSDPLCRLATGGGLRKRKLFSDNSLAAYDVIRPVIASGIDPTAFNLDIIERLFTIELTRPDVYLTEEEVTDRFEASLPGVLGALLTLAGKVIAMLPEIQLATPPRMADFATVGEAVAQAEGCAPLWFIETYREMLDSAAADNAEGDPVFGFVETEIIYRFAKIMSLKIGAELRVKASDFHNKMTQDERNNILLINRQDIPRNARVFSSRLLRVRSQLKEAGFAVDKLKSDRSWQFKVDSPELLQRIINKQADLLKSQSLEDSVPF